MSRADGLTLGLIVFGVVLAESLILTDLVAPGEVGLVVAGAAAAQNGTPLAVVICAASVGALVGDSTGYVIGRRFGPGLVEHGILRRLRSSQRRARHFFDRHGSAAVAIARWVGALRAVVPIVAGSAQLGAGSFFIAAIPSAIAWTAVMATIGFVWGDGIADVVDRIGIALSIAVVAAGVIVVVVMRRRRRSREFARP